MPKPSISLVVPCYNEQDSIDVFLDRALPVLTRVSHSFEIIFVDDGSTDTTVERIAERQSQLTNIRLLSLSRNFGKEAALTAGLDHAQGDVVVPIDVDLQDPPELIEDFVERWVDGADIVVGVRKDRTSDSFGKRFFARNFYRVYNSISDLPIPADAGDFRLMDRRVVEAVKRIPERQRFMKGILHWVGFRSDYVEFTREARVVGQGKWASWRLWNFALDGMFSFSTVPLRVWTYFGAMVATVAFIYMLFLVFRTLILGIDVAGYASLAVLVLFSISFNMVGIGILGEYVGRIFVEVKGRPIYLIATDTGETGVTQATPPPTHMPTSKG
jgi:glycosyltransferase involved in cell wall biosynthesis